MGNWIKRIEYDVKNGDIKINDSKNEISISYNLTAKQISEYQKKALRDGDTGAYNILSVNYLESHYEGFLYTALIMANRHKNGQAYIDVYYCLTDYPHKKENTELDDLDKETRILALQYLIRGASIGNSECKLRLNRYINYSKYKNIIQKLKDIELQLQKLEGVSNNNELGNVFFDE